MMFRSHRRALSVLAAPLLLALAISPVLAAASFETVRGNTVDVSAGENGSTGWWFARDPGNTVPYEFNNAEASTGDGSLYVFPLTSEAARKFIGEYFALQTVADPATVAISYDYFVATSALLASENKVFLNVYVNRPESLADKFYDCRFDFVPAAVATGSWNTASVTATTPATTVAKSGTNPSADPCPTTIGGMPVGSTLRMFSLNVGHTTANDQGLSAYLDNVVFSVDGDQTTFDFEAPLPQPATKDDCKKNGWKSLYDDQGNSFKNQGDCVSFVATNGKKKGKG